MSTFKVTGVGPVEPKPNYDTFTGVLQDCDKDIYLVRNGNILAVASPSTDDNQHFDFQSTGITLDEILASFGPVKRYTIKELILQEVAGN